MSTLTVPSAEASPEVAVTRPARRGTRPRITLPIFHLPPSSASASPSPNVMLQRPRVAAAAGVSPIHSPMINVPVTPGAAGAIPIGNPAGPFGLMQLYPTKASEFMFKQFEGFKDFTMNTAKSGLSVGEKIAFWLYNKVRSWSKRWFTHMFLFMVVLTYSLLGALLFVAVEGTHEEIAMKDLRKERYALIHDLRNLDKQQYLLDDDKAWDSEALKRLRDFEDHLYEQFKHGLSDSEKKVWSFWNAVFYCGTIYTTIGYGHISPSTTTGRAITIVYAIFGIPLFLILLADFGKLFTRGIKFLWAFVRRLYYTGSCKRVRRTAPVQEVWKGVQLVYDFATFRRPSQIPPGEGAATEEDEEASVPLQQPQPQQQQQNLQVQQQQQQPQHDNLQTVLPIDGLEPGTPAPSAFEVDDEFNLPISIAIFILLAYIFVGASVYFVWEEWGFFESFYFVFISMSTIGFGDFVPQHPMYMMASIVYLVFGLALTSMCINVVQIKLSDSFRQASAKLGATIGLRMAEEEAALTPSPVVEVTDVQPTITKSLSS